MRLRCIFLSFIAGVFFHLCWFQKAHCSGEPASPLCSQSPIEISSALLDIGLVVPGNQYSYSVTFRNRGASPVDIRLVRTSTAQLEARASPSRLDPGMAGELKITFSPQMWPPGPFSSSVVVYSSDALDPGAKVVLAGLIRYPISWEPIHLEFTVQKGRPEPPPRVRITPRGDSALGPLKITPKVPYLSAKAEPDQSSKSVFVAISVDPSAPFGVYTGSIDIETNNPIFPLLTLLVRYEVLGDLRALPDVMDFGFIEEAKPTEARIAIENHGDREVQLQKIESGLAVEAKVNFKRVDKGRYEVSMQIPSPPPLQELDGRLTVLTDHPDQPVIKVPVKGWVWARKPFDLLSADKDDSRLFGLTKAALEKDQLISPADIVVKILGGRRDDQAVSLLERMLLNDDWLVRTRAVQVLGRMGNAKTLEHLRRLVTDDPDEEVRRFAADSLVRISGKDALPQLLLAIRDDDSWVRQDAAYLLGNVGDPRAIPALECALKDEEEDVREEAQLALEKLQEMPSTNNR